MRRLFPIIVSLLGSIPFASGDPAPAPVKMQASTHPQLRAADDTGLKFTLKQAENYALANHPHIAAATLDAEAVRQEIRVARSAFFPQIYGESDSVYARRGASRLAAQDNLSDTNVYSRQSDGILVSQLLTDFGRTYELTESAHFRADAAGDRANVARAVVVLAVDRSYFEVLRSDAIARVADETVNARDIAFRQIAALAKTGLKSTLDVNFAQVNLSQAQLLQIQADSSRSQAEAELSTALGFSDAQHFTLAEEPMDSSLAPTAEDLIQLAIRQRPELANLRDELEASQRFAKAQDAAKYPTISALGGAGVNPKAVRTVFPGTYYTAGINVQLPILTGGKLDAQADQAHDLAEEASANLVDAQNTISRDVRVAWLNAKTAQERIGVTEQMVQAADQAQKLARARYSLGTSSIVEFIQAQLNYTEAELQATSAKYDYQAGRALLNFTTGSSF